MASEVRSMLSVGTMGVGPENKGFLPYPFSIPMKNRESHFYHECEAAEPIQNLHKAQDDHPKTDNGGHPSRALGSLI